MQILFGFMEFFSLSFLDAVKRTDAGGNFPDKRGGMGGNNRADPALFYRITEKAKLLVAKKRTLPQYRVVFDDGRINRIKALDKMIQFPKAVIAVVLARFFTC